MKGDWLMKKRTLVIAVTVITLIIIIPIAWWLASPLWSNQSVDEAFPFELPVQETLAAMPAEEVAAIRDQFADALPDATAVAQMPVEQRQLVEQKAMELAAALPATEMDEPMPAEPAIVAQGEFVDGDSFHKGSGQTTIYRLADGSHLLRFEQFTVTNGPDLHVLLATNPRPANSSELDEYVDLGSLKGNLGNQNYVIGPDIDVSRYNSVVIYCLPFHVVFASATLM
jgi:hypothetical protein